MIAFISIVMLTFALALIVLGAITIWLERGPGRLKGIALIIVGLPWAIYIALKGLDTYREETGIFLYRS